MTMTDVNYFTCTLGQAALLATNPNSKTITEFIKEQATRLPDVFAAGFYDTGAGDRAAWTSRVLTFSDIHRGSCVVAERLSSTRSDASISKSISKGINETTRRFNIRTARASKVAGTISPPKCQTVALLCPSTADFLFVWLALMRLGHPVLLLAPQCSPYAVAQLCKTCEVEQLFYDDLYESLASKSSMEVSASGEGLLNCNSIQSILSTSIFEVIKQEPINRSSVADVSNRDIAYLHHTSGTSSGTPKPVPQTHRAGLGVLPRLDGRNEATFTTTPLYHGGIADLLRAWTSDGMMWLFPGKGLPITPANITNCLNIAQDYHRSHSTPSVKYFSSVPYVLQRMAANEAGLEKLQEMKIVGVGGAALPAEIGDKLVQGNVNLISRFGSAECGFLMSSHRDYADDKDWQYLRAGSKINTISFEQRDDGLSELIVLPGWPHVAKTNRENGSYATADLFEPHPVIKNAWRYHSRADSQMTLITGKKFDPAPLEAAITTSKLLKDVLIFGDGKPYPGVLLFRSEEAKNKLDEDLITELEPMIGKINIESQSHVRLARSMLVPMPFSNNPLEKSSKGTIQRREADERYTAEIEQAYTKMGLEDGRIIEDDQVSTAILQVVVSVMGTDKNFDAETDLFSYGVDSVACVQIRHALLQLLPEKCRDLSLTVVEDCGTIGRLAQLIISRRRGEDYIEEDQQRLMLDLVEKYSIFSEMPKKNGHTASQPPYQATEKPSGEVILLTGATGALGAHILHLYLKSSNVTQIFCLVRGASEHAAVERVSKALSSRKLGSLTSKVTILRSDLASPTLSLGQPTYTTLASTVTTIHHVAWAVNFRLSVSSFSSNLASLQNLINLALCSPGNPPNFIFCSSVASVANSPPGNAVPEAISTNTSDCGPLGYSKSKWIAERICHAAHERTRLQGRMTVMRVGQLSGATDTGIWNMREAYPTMLSQVSLTNTLPNLRDLPLSWLPVDTAASSFVEIAESMKSSDEIRVYHIVNTDEIAQWSDLLGWAKNLHPNLEVTAPPAFVRKLEELQKRGNGHPAMKLVPHWKVAYGSEDTNGADADAEQPHQKTKKKEPDAESEQRQGLSFTVKQILEVAPALKEVQPVDEAYFGKIWRWVLEQEREAEVQVSADKIMD